ncbi:hypothetical protein NDU88_001934 [Pleurodeles waltl]|uniref:Uncharacterized protein n=1 Tax=Pleurodeles waltl TaxID=8319 RepID=A0AAV7R9F3_PLEWA|nr:hypothetical protein NDU88_001934 [Pleurodeles waltl]
MGRQENRWSPLPKGTGGPLSKTDQETSPGWGPDAGSMPRDPAPERGLQQCITLGAVQGTEEMNRGGGSLPPTNTEVQTGISDSSTPRHHSWT